MAIIFGQTGLQNLEFFVFFLSSKTNLYAANFTFLRFYSNVLLLFGTLQPSVVVF